MKLSASLLPLKEVFLGPPVRISPGHTGGHVDVVFQEFRTEASEKPVKTNFATLYGKRSGTLILPGIEEMLTMCPRHHR